MLEPVTVFCLDAHSALRAEALAEEFSLSHVEASSLSDRSKKERLRFYHETLSELPALAFVLEAGVVQLALIEELGVLAIRAGFHGSGLDYRREKGGGRSEMIAKAVGLKGGKSPSVVDATAGLGVDAFVLASLGCSVTLLERVPAVNALLRDGLERSKKYAEKHDPELDEILSRMRLCEGEASAYLKRLASGEQPDVVYLDPMFPDRKKSAAVKKEMQIFHKLVGPDQDADRLLELALTRARERVVVKRPRIAPNLDGPVPSHVLKGKRNRYDVYIVR